ncbi:C40 family peptidase [bacterium]|jgi:cell wall-associated NlpC family hydrolase|nr:C40 family peptidase [bacterium]
MITQKTIIEKYVGIPYRHCGRKISGLDCWGLVKNVYKDLGYELLDMDEDSYAVNWARLGNNYFIENYHKEWEQVYCPQTYDGVLFQNRKGICDHAGVVLSGNKFIHTCRAGTVISSLNNKSWKDKIYGFYRLKRMSG